MKIGDKSNYFTRYLKLKQNKYKASVITHDTKTQSIDKTKQEAKSNYKEAKSTIEIMPYSQSNKNKTHKKVQSLPIDLKTITKSEHNARGSEDDAQSKRKIVLISEEITVDHIDFLERKIKKILNVINEFEKENNLNQKPALSSLCVNEEPQTERISNKINEKLSMPHTNGLNYKTIRHSSFSSKDSTNYSIKNNPIQQTPHMNFKDSLVSQSRQSRQKQNHYQSSSMKGSLQINSQLIVTKKTAIYKNAMNRNCNPQTRSSLMTNRVNKEKTYVKSNEGVQSSKTIRKGSNKRVFSKRSLREDSMTSNEKHIINTSMDDSSINLIIDEYLADESEKGEKKPLTGIPIKNFTKIKEVGGTMPKATCQSDRMKKCILPHFLH